MLFVQMNLWEESGWKVARLQCLRSLQEIPLRMRAKHSSRMGKSNIGL